MRSVLPLRQIADAAPAWWRVLTVLQPFGSLIIEGLKDVENRPWGPADLPTGGAWFLVHAGSRPYEASGLAGRLEAILGAPVDLADAQRFPRKALLGWAYLAQVRGLAAFPGNPWASGPRCWHVPFVLRFPEPIVCAGDRGLWPIGEAARRPDGSDPRRHVELEAKVRATGVLPPSLLRAA